MDFLNEWFWFFLSVPFAALAGWVVGRRGGQRHGQQQVNHLSRTYFRGLNYLLNDQSDHAIELFLHIAELDKETFETQLVLGHLFRRRGEVDRAIRLHQGLEQRGDLSDQQRVQALLALGEDYMKSGLLDRAETVFNRLAQIDQRAPQALRHLIGLYQAERDWEKAIDNASRYEDVTGEPMGKQIAQFQCELAERHHAAGQFETALELIKRAYQSDATSVRAGIIEGKVEADRGHDDLAVKAWERAARHDPEYLPEIIPALMQAYQRKGEQIGARHFLSEMTEHYRGIAPVLALTHLIAIHEGPAEARTYLSEQLKDRPSVRGELALIEITLATNSDPHATLLDLKQITDQLLVRNPSYRCTHCGFGAKTHHWLCPSCKEWGSVKPLLNFAVT